MEKVYAYRQMASAPVAQTDAPRLHDAIKDMDMRMQRLGDNSQAVAEYLDEYRPEGITVLYPLLTSFQDYQRAKELLLRPPGIFTLKCTLPQDRFDALAQRIEKVYLQANSFNGKLRTSSISHIQSHKSVGDAERQAQAGITPQLIRLSPGTVDRPESAVRIMREIIGDWQRSQTS
jgi:cystathionine beta-lyase/cystathionine gamma-synthase